MQECDTRYFEAMGIDLVPGRRLTDDEITLSAAIVEGLDRRDEPGKSVEEQSPKT